METIKSKQQRKLKLHPDYKPRAYSKTRLVPSLKLSGVWLEQSGFKIGETVLVTVNNGELIIRTESYGNTRA